MPSLIEWDGEAETPLSIFGYDGDAESPYTLSDGMVAPPPPVTPQPELVGIYNGPELDVDDTTFSVFGTYPPIASRYYIGTNTINVDHHTAQIGRGTRPLITISTRNATVSLHDIADNTEAAQTWMDNRIGAVHTLSQVDENIPVTIALESEFEVKVNQGLITGVSEAQYAQALDVFHTRCHANAPDVKTDYWFGGSDWTKIRNVINNMNVPPKQMSFDPYRNPSWQPANPTFRQVTEAKLNNLLTTPGYIALGEPPVAISETGTDRSYGDASGAAYIESIIPGLNELGLKYALWFNRDSGPINNSKIDGYGFDLSVAALGAAMSAGT